MNKSSKRKTVYVGLSGGVDSAVTAALLVQQGYEVVGVHMRLAPNSPEENTDAVREICKTLKIPLKIYSLQKEFRDEVINTFIDEYKSGRTPNPCVYCNKKFKFGTFFKKAIADGADYVATGHYARVVDKNGEFKLYKGKDQNKDQSYFLYNLNQSILKHTLFPLGELTKAEVRTLAKDMNLPVAEKRESQDVCFILHNDTQKFLHENIKSSEGPIIDIDSGKVLGTHEGLPFYTIGQRKGVGIGGSDEPYFVVGKDSKKNELYVGKGENNPALYKQKIRSQDINWISDIEPNIPLKCEVSIRYRQKPARAIVRKENGEYGIEFGNPIRAISPGQSAVLFLDDECLGGGIIKSGS